MCKNVPRVAVLLLICIFSSCSNKADIPQKATPAEDNLAGGSENVLPQDTESFSVTEAKTKSEGEEGEGEGAEDEFWSTDASNESEPTPSFLSEYPFFQDMIQQSPSETLFSYSLNNTHFSDYALVSRFLYLPKGSKIQYQEAGNLAFPVGSILIQNFAYPKDMNLPKENLKLIETRLLIHQNSGWEALAYQWKEDGSDARKAIAGGLVTVNWMDKIGQSQELRYVILNKNDCKRCHENKNIVAPIGIRIENLNATVDTEVRSIGQFELWKERGIIEGLPELLDQIPKWAQWNDPNSGTIDQRARAWLAVNCAHCHNPNGAGGVSGLDLTMEQDNPLKLGIFKPPVAAGRSSEGLQYSIAPGDPDASFLINRLVSTDPSVMMPPVGRRLPDSEAVALIREWIGKMRYDEKDAQKLKEQQLKAYEYLKIHGKWPESE